MKTIACIEYCILKEMRFNFSCKMKSIFVFNDVISISLHDIKYVVYTELKLCQQLEEIFFSRRITGIVMDCIIDRDVDVG
jgi:hypothetical protein